MYGEAGVITYREASLADISGMQVVRNSVKENALSDPGLVKDEDYTTYLTQRGKGWVCLDHDTIVGFAIADLHDNNIWALFLLPAYEGMGIGSRLHDTMLRWYFSQTSHTVWLSTSPGTRAERFYRRAGWKETGMYGKGEIRFEMDKVDFRDRGAGEPAALQQRKNECPISKSTMQPDLLTFEKVHKSD